MDVTVSGQALVDGGLVGFDTISGIGLVTFGFIWGCPDIWNPVINEPTTTWTLVTNINNIETCMGD